MNLSPTEKMLAKMIADTANFAAETSKVQQSLANFMMQHLPGVPESEKAEFLARIESSWLQVQGFQDKAKKVLDALK